MLKKYMLILFFFLCYSTLPLQPYAETQNEKNNRELEDFILNDELQEEAEPKTGQKKSFDSDLDCTKDIPFTLAQKKRLDQIYHQIYMDYIDLIETYAWAGALTQDQKIIRYKMLRNYIHTFQKRNYKWCSEHEEDEWEEEWFNIDHD
jgi:hypothetical protein